MTRTEHTLRLAGHDVAVVGESGVVRARWTLRIDGDAADVGETARGDLVLRGTLPDGSPLLAEVHQGAFGPARVVVRHGDDTEVRFTGFVL
ncbi:MAG: hypothetical protein IT200_11345 [Thermoleophilia bacterium]|nr:hypothetical protein [Thermoleophilia bacterium]